MVDGQGVDDAAYWERYYSEKREPFEPSLFAQYVCGRYLRAGQSLAELGCGNGRDAIYLSRNGLSVTAVDQCGSEIEFLTQAYAHADLQFVQGDFTDLDSSQKFGHVYSRFSMHSVSSSGQAAVLAWASNVLEVGGYLLLEFRGKRNELFGKGQVVDGDPDAYFYDGHYRRFLEVAAVERELESAGFEIVESEERAGFSPINGVDETFARVIARRHGN